MKVTVAHHVGVDALARQIAEDCDSRYADGPTDAAPACRNAAEFANTWMRGDAAVAVSRAARQHGADLEPMIYLRTWEELLKLYDPARHGEQAKGQGKLPRRASRATRELQVAVGGSPAQRRAGLSR